MKFKELFKLIPTYVYIEVVVTTPKTMKEVTRYGFFDDGYDGFLDNLTVFKIVPSCSNEFCVYVWEGKK